MCHRSGILRLLTFLSAMHPYILLLGLSLDIYWWPKEMFFPTTPVVGQCIIEKGKTVASTFPGHLVEPANLLVCSWEVLAYSRRGSQLNSWLLAGVGQVFSCDTAARLRVSGWGGRQDMRRHLQSMISPEQMWVRPVGRSFVLFVGYFIWSQMLLVCNKNFAHYLINFFSISIYIKKHHSPTPYKTHAYHSVIPTLYVTYSSLISYCIDEFLDSNTLYNNASTN